MYKEFISKIKKVTVHENTLQGLQEALDYVKGDKTRVADVNQIF